MRCQVRDVFSAKLRRTGASIIRVFSYWRTVLPEECFDRVVDALRKLAEQAKPHGVTIGIENEHWFRKTGDKTILS